MKRVAFMYPGQGSQAVGMTKKLYDTNSEIRSLYEKANEILNKDLTKIMFEGPKELLTETVNTQPALLLSSMGVDLLLKQYVKPVMTLGHSLGEYSALVSANAISLDEALPLVATRGELMEKAFPKGKGTMAAVLGLSQQAIEAALKESDEIVDVANLNCPGQIVISGTTEGIEEARKLLKEAGAKRVLPLNVSGPFHSRLMKQASEKFFAYLQDVSFHHASIPVYANVTAAPVKDSDEIKDLLIKQLYSPVRFEESIRKMMDADIDAFVEVGNGKVLSGLVKKIDRKVKTFAVQDEQSMQDFISWYEGDNQ
ncbi:ACP S-malonyltransferase [Virgibacillus sp. W0181]|uniref:ACP S-malonyltransferase n=1 Tax=Virgibacillus sp. W0181 TaxID=3391581 RepID=UPI003F4498B7